MDWKYVSGFFDADGSITLSKPSNSKYKTVCISFHNNELAILNEIQKFIFNETGIKGTIVKKKPKKINHHVAYDLKYNFFEKAVLVLKKMKLIHPKKKHRAQITFLLHKKVPRNGKCTSSLLLARQELEEKFFVD